jgi:hypothetical protein
LEMEHRAMNGTQAAGPSDVNLKIKEAETCYSMGMFEESLTLYEHVIASGKSIPPQARQTLSEKVGRIRKEILERQASESKGLSPEDIADACRWDTDPIKTVEALVSAGWLDRDDLGLSIHEWLDYQSESEKSKLLNAKRQARHREKYGLKFRQSRRGNGGVTEDRDKHVTTDGAYRADGRNGADAADGLDAVADATSATAAAAFTAAHSDPADPDPILAVFPCRGGGIWPARESLARKLDEFYPELNIDDELRSALAWMAAAPEERCKPPGEMRKFVTSWLQRSRNGNGKKGGGDASPKA